MCYFCMSVVAPNGTAKMFVFKKFFFFFRQSESQSTESQCPYVLSYKRLIYSFLGV